MKWVSVKERLPEKEGKYLIYIDNEWFDVGRWDGKNFRWAFDGGGGKDDGVTHWSPLPVPPKDSTINLCREHGLQKISSRNPVDITIIEEVHSKKCEW